MLISIITVNYNNAKDLEKTINSVISQTFHNYEFIIIDGGSSDNSTEVIRKNRQYITFWVSEKDAGIYNAMNKGLSHATGKWTFFLNSGDMFASSEVLRSVNFDVDDEVGAIYGRYKFYDRYDKLQLNEVNNAFSVTKRRYRSMGFSHQSVFVRTELAKKFMFDETFKLCADYNMMMQIYKSGYKFRRDNTIISICDGRGGASYKNRHLQDLEQARVCGCDKDIAIRAYLLLTNIIRPVYRFIRKLF